jgi:hypothetical protein
MVLVKLNKPVGMVCAGLLQMGNRLGDLLRLEYPDARAVVDVLYEIQSALSFFEDDVVCKKWIATQVMQGGRCFTIASREVRKVRCVACSFCACVRAK